MPYDVNAIRKSLQKAVSGRFSDPDEFRPEKAKSNVEPLKYRFFILPPLQSGDVLKAGSVKKSMDNVFLRHGQHWINDRPHPCPRVYDGSECAVCSTGFQLLQECKDKKLGDERKQAILRQWMPTTYYMVNIFFTNWKGNPEELRNKVKFYNAPKTCVDKWTATLMRDDKGDDEDPDAFGVFFDESSAFCFELAVLKEGKSNSYKTSAFVKNNGIPVPMIRNADDTPNTKAIELLLKSRLNLWEKVEVPDPEKLRRLSSQLISGDDADDAIPSGGGFDDDENTAAPEPAKAVSPPEEKPKQVVSRTEAKAKKPELFEDEEEPKPKSQPQAVKAKEVVKQAPAMANEEDEDIDSLLKQLDD